MIPLHAYFSPSLRGGDIVVVVATDFTHNYALIYPPFPLISLTTNRLPNIGEVKGRVLSEVVKSRAPSRALELGTHLGYGESLSSHEEELHALTLTAQNNEHQFHVLSRFLFPTTM